MKHICFNNEVRKAMNRSCVEIESEWYTRRGESTAEDAKILQRNEPTKLSNEKKGVTARIELKDIRYGHQK